MEACYKVVGRLQISIFLSLKSWGKDKYRANIAKGSVNSIKIQNGAMMRIEDVESETSRNTWASRQPAILDERISLCFIARWRTSCAILSRELVLLRFHLRHSLGDFNHHIFHVLLQNFP